MPAAACQVQALLPAQLDGTIALRRLEHTTHPAQPTTADPHKRRSEAPLTRLAGPSRSPGRPVACSTRTSPCPAQPPSTTMVPGLHACWPLWALRSPDLRGRMAQRIAGEGLTGPHDGAQHQARNRVRRGLPLTDDYIATSPVDEPSICDSSLKATDQLVFVPMEHREPAARAGAAAPTRPADPRRHLPIPGRGAHDHSSKRGDHLVTVQDLTTAEVAGLFRVSEQAVRQWASDDQLPSAWVRGRRRYPAAAVAELAQEHDIPLPAWLHPATPTPQEPV